MYVAKQILFIFNYLFLFCDDWQYVRTDQNISELHPIIVSRIKLMYNTV